MPRVFPGRQESFGLGKETVSGTGVAPSQWIPHLALTIDPKTTVAQNNSALGRIEDINDSLVVGQWVEGSLQAKAFDVNIGLILLNLFGTEVSAVKETTAYNHTFTVNNVGTAPTLTLVRVNPNATRRFVRGEVTEFELTITSRDWAQYTASLMAQTGVTASDTAAYASENEWTSKHTVTKLATNTAGLAAAPALDVKSVKLKISAKNDAYIPFGGIDVTSFDPTEFSVTGELVLRYNDATLEALGTANTRQALSITLANTDVIIGASSNPALSFTMPKVRLAPISLDNNLSTVLNQTVAFTAEFDTVAGAMITAVLTNTRSTAY